ncbi:unnamed protein product [Sympodiomycopsis kandeliae]
MTASSQTMTLLFLVALSLSSVTLTTAQVVPTSSIDPLNGSSFSTPVFTPQQTFTPATTYNSAGSRTPTSINGPGPSITPASYTFSYDEPLSSVQGTPLSNLYSSLAANGTPTAATDPLFPDPSNLQIVAASTGADNGASNGAASQSSLLSSSASINSLTAVLTALVTGVVMVVAFV